MDEFAITGLITLVSACAAVLLFRLISYAKSPAPRQPSLDYVIKLSPQLDPDILNCRAKPTKDKKNDSTSDVFIVEICGSIHAPSDMHDTTLKVSIMDVTDGPEQPKQVRAKLKQWRTKDSSAFCYKADLGKLPYQITTLSEWTSVARLSLDWMLFPRKGERSLQISTSILSGQNGQELASAECTTTCENSNPGYIDLEENIQRTRTLAVALAFAVSAADNKLFECEIDLIKKWARGNVDLHQASDKAERKLEKALNKTVAFFRAGNQLNTYKICKELVEIAPIAERYDILELCLHVAQAKGSATSEELTFLKSLANWLQVDKNKFRALMEKILPVNLHKVKDVETILGVTSGMDKEEARQQLNKEYIKWNSRVTSSDPEIQTMADQVLDLIAQARNEYVGVDSSN